MHSVKFSFHHIKINHNNTIHLVFSFCTLIILVIQISNTKSNYRRRISIQSAGRFIVEPYLFFCLGSLSVCGGSHTERYLFRHRTHTSQRVRRHRAHIALLLQGPICCPAQLNASSENDTNEMIFGVPVGRACGYVCCVGSQFSPVGSQEPRAAFGSCTNSVISTLWHTMHRRMMIF